MSRRTFRTLAPALDGLRAGWTPRTLLADVQRVWPEVVGEAIAREADPAAEREGVLTVTCSSSLWAHELDLMGPGIVEGLNTALGTAALRRLRCRATPVARRAG